MADRSRGRKQDRVLHNWRRVVMSAMSRPSAQPGRFGQDFPESVPSSLPEASNINTILQVANEIQHEAPNVARIPCNHKLGQNVLSDDPYEEDFHRGGDGDIGF